MKSSPLSFTPTIAAQKRWAELAEQVEKTSAEQPACVDAMLATAVSRYAQLHGERDAARLLHLLALKLFKAAEDEAAQHARPN